jgi:hypothetical protein
MRAITPRGAKPILSLEVLMKYLALILVCLFIATPVASQELLGVPQVNTGAQTGESAVLFHMTVTEVSPRGGSRIIATATLGGLVGAPIPLKVTRSIAYMKSCDSDARGQKPRCKAGTAETGLTGTVTASSRGEDGALTVELDMKFSELSGMGKASLPGATEYIDLPDIYTTSTTASFQLSGDTEQAIELHAAAIGEPHHILTIAQIGPLAEAAAVN